MSVPVRLAVVVAAVLAATTGFGHAQPQTPSYTAAQAKSGAEFYSGNCSACHGEGVDDGQFGPALKGPAHVAYWSGKTAEDLLNYMAANMPPSQPGGLGGQAYADIFAYLLQSAGQAPGDTPIPVDPAALKGAAPTR